MYYSHAQPPLFNLFTGIIVKIFPQHYGHVFHVLFLMVTWITALFLYILLRKLSLPNWLCLLVALYFMLCPAVVLYENVFSYTSIVVLLLTVSVFCLINVLEKRNSTSWLLFWISLCALSLTRSSFHILWLMAAFFIMLFLFRKTEILSVRNSLLALIPVSVVFLWYLKNLILFGAFTSSTWMGMNIARIMPPETALGKIGAFRPIREYKMISPDQRYPDVKLLHEELKQNTGIDNFYHIDYIQVSEQFKSEVLSEIRSKPLQYLNRVKGAFIIYFSPSTHGPFLDKNHKHISTYAAIMNADFSGYVKFRKDVFPVRDTILILAIYVLLFGFIIYGFMRGLYNVNDRILIVFLSFVLLSMMVITNFLEYGENNRFRFEMITVVLVLLAKAGYTVICSLRFKVLLRA